MNIVEALVVIDDIEPHSAAMNMALDEALLNTVRAPTLRFYRWQMPSVSFGYFSKFRDVHTYAPERQLVRRSTGGGIVLHGHDVTYSFIVPQTHPLYATPPLAIYTELHTAIQAACRRNGVETVLADGASERVSDACFANPVRADLLAHGQKIAGAAQRKSRAGLLHQGSIQWEGLTEEFREAFASQICATFRRAKIDPPAAQVARQLADGKYGTSEWLQRR